MYEYGIRKTGCCCKDCTRIVLGTQGVVVNTEWEMVLGTQGVVVKTEWEMVLGTQGGYVKIE